MSGLIRNRTMRPDFPGAFFLCPCGRDSYLGFMPAACMSLPIVSSTNVVYVNAQMDHAIAVPSVLLSQEFRQVAA